MFGQASEEVGAGKVWSPVGLWCRGLGLFWLEVQTCPWTSGPNLLSETNDQPSACPCSDGKGRFMMAI